MESPRIRRLARERALQYLFGLDITKDEWTDGLEDFWANTPAKPGVRNYAEKLIEGVARNQTDLDTQISKSLRDWTPERIGGIERAIIRVALFEMIHCSDVPAGVAINEAIEVAKRYGGDEAPRFVNGILDEMRKQLIEAAL